MTLTRRPHQSCSVLTRRCSSLALWQWMRCSVSRGSRERARQYAPVSEAGRGSRRAVYQACTLRSVWRQELPGDRIWERKAQKVSAWGNKRRRLEQASRQPGCAGSAELTQGGLFEALLLSEELLLSGALGAAEEQAVETGKEGRGSSHV